MFMMEEWHHYNELQYSYCLTVRHLSHVAFEFKVENEIGEKLSSKCAEIFPPYCEFEYK